MFMSDINDVKIYNLSAGKSLPDFLTDQKRRALLRKNLLLNKRIELIQDFDMPDECGTVSVSPDFQYIIATGTYKPRVKCYELANLSVKFERCFDSQVVACEVLSDDYSKMVFLQNDRYIEFHTAPGRHYRIRIPRCGYDMKYHQPTCDLYIVGASSEIYRFNLERGQYLQPYQTASNSSIHCCDVNPAHHLLCVGTNEGTVEAWDPRDRTRCGILDVAMKLTHLNKQLAISAIRFKDELTMAVGTADGFVLLYDIRSKEPLLIKDHLNRLPIRKIHFNKSEKIVYTLDRGIFKLWNEMDGKQVAYIESESSFTDFCTIPNTGMFFFGQQTSKMLTYYIPSMGPAPKWCSFLDNLTEEIESETVQNIYDDYKFITRQELEALNLDHLIGSNLLRAYMHGFFIDVRLYNKVKATVEPFTFDQYRKEKIRQKIEDSRPNRLKIKSNLPTINQEVALKYLDEEASGKKNRSKNLLKDDRFKAMFENPEFEIDKNAMEYKLLTPVLSRLDKNKLKELKRRATLEQEVADKEEDGKSTDDDLFSEQDDSSDDDGQTWTKDAKKQYKQIMKNQFDDLEGDDGSEDIDDEPMLAEESQTKSSVKMIEVASEEFNPKKLPKRISKTSLAERVANDISIGRLTTVGGMGNRTMTFSTKPVAKDVRKREKEMQKHRDERKRVIRPITSLRLKKYIPKS